MGDIFSFIEKFGGFTFVEKPLCEVDGLILSHLSYYVYDGIVPGIYDRKKAVSLYDLTELMDEENFVSVTWEAEANKKLFEEIVKSRRYRNIRANFYVNEIDDEEEVQFSAITFILGNGDIFISFRGTDDLLVGWKEDFYMAYRTPVGSQIRSERYVNYIWKLLRRKHNAQFYFGGHSKGGNLAVYAAIKCDEKLKHRILKVFNFDGPGFLPQFMEELDYESIKDRVMKFIPDESFVGMLMECKQDYILIQSTKIGIAQHIVLTWCVEKDYIKRSACEFHKRKVLYDKINKKIIEMDSEQAKDFINNLFKLIDITEARTLTELKGGITDLSKKISSIKETFKNMDEDNRQIFLEFASFMIEILAEDQHERLKKWNLFDNSKND